MPVIEWSEQYSIGIPSVDEQHKTLVGFINRLNEAMAVGEAREVLADILVGLSQYTKEHFSYEEELFARFGYAESESHINEHHRMIKRVHQFSLDFQQDASGAISLELMQFMTNWLLNHIQHSDRDYAPFLIAKGVK